MLQSSVQRFDGAIVSKRKRFDGQRANFASPGLLVHEIPLHNHFGQLSLLGPVDFLAATGPLLLKKRQPRQPKSNRSPTEAVNFLSTSSRATSVARARGHQPGQFFGAGLTKRKKDESSELR